MAAIAFEDPFSVREWVKATEVKLDKFIHEVVIPAEPRFLHEINGRTDRFGDKSPTIEMLKHEAKSLGLWNLFVPQDAGTGPGLTTVEYARMAEKMGWSPLAAIACNCSAPDTGNMEVLLAYGSPEQKQAWLKPLLDGKIRSAFLMTEPTVASSDARNIQTSIELDGDGYVINGKKWWATGAGSPDCEILFVMGKTDTTADELHQQSIILVPRNTPGVKIMRHLTVFGYDDAPEGHAEVHLENVRVPRTNLVGAPGDGFVIAQSRLGRGRIHHCMRAIGLAERCMQTILKRVTDETRRPFGRILAEHATTQVELAESRIHIEAARLMVMHAANKIDQVGAKFARKEISMIKVFVPRVILEVIDRGIQLFGAAGVSDDTILARAWAGMRTLRIADGPDMVHLRTIALLELKSFSKSKASLTPKAKL